VRLVKGGGEREGPWLRVTDAVVIPRDELLVRASRSGGPGGQHVNTSSTRIEITWNVRRSPSLDDTQRARVVSALSSRLDSDGNVRVVASDTRSQLQNRALAEQRLGALVRAALKVPKPRKRTRPHRGAVERRLEEKKRRSSTKRERREPGED
jgi:ribosome-associated protein